jgi:hypothetical protein
MADGHNAKDSSAPNRKFQVCTANTDPEEELAAMKDAGSLTSLKEHIGRLSSCFLNADHITAECEGHLSSTQEKIIKQRTKFQPRLAFFCLDGQSDSTGIEDSLTTVQNYIPGYRSCVWMSNQLAIVLKILCLRMEVRLMSNPSEIV